MTTLIDAPDAATATAAWWTMQLGAPRFDNGGDGIAGMLATILLASQPPVGEDRFYDFATTLRQLIQTQLDGPYPQVPLGVDYHPDRILTQAAVKAGVPTNVFPWKTDTYTTKQAVTATPGYGGRQVLVWKADDFEVPVCHTQQYNDEGPLPFKCGLLMWHEEAHQYTVPALLCTQCQRPADHYWHDQGEEAFRNSHEFQS